MSEATSVPTHIGYIVDGNRRWAKKHGLPSYEGHLAGYNTLKDIVVETANAGVKFISLYAFSTENWKRDDSEVNGLMKLLLRLMKTDLRQLISEDLKLIVLGSREGLSEKVCEAIIEAEKQTAHCTKATIAVCFNYGGQQEIVRAVQHMIKAGMDPDAVTPESFASYLYHPEVPPCDLIVRTSGEQRLSNFMLWRSAYSEFIFLKKLWPDMRKEDVAAIIEEYGTRHRRIGK